LTRTLRATAVALTALATTLISGTPAHASVIDLSCTRPSLDMLLFDPPVAMEQQTITVDKTTNYRQCSSATAPEVTSGELLRVGARLDSCPQAFAAGIVVQTITWNTGETSTLRLSRSATLIDGIYTVSFIGTVTAGLFLGSTAQQQYVANGVDLEQCLDGKATVVKSIISTVTLTISH
jgi:hypothetical protein